MKHYVAAPLIALLLLGISFPKSCGAQDDAVGVFRKVSPSVVRLHNAASTGTGVVLTKGGLILTNAHVVSAPLPFHCTVDVLKDGKQQTVTFKKVKVTKVHKTLDLALVQIDPAEHNAMLGPCRLSKEKGVVGQRLYAIGNPGTESEVVLSKTITEGLLSGVDRTIEGEKYYQFSAAINPGNSGGPLSDRGGTVVGIVTLKLSDVDNVGFAIPVYDIQMTDFEEYRRKTIDAAKAVALLKKAEPLLEKVRLQSNIENTRKDEGPSLEMELLRAILFQLCQEAAYYDPNNADVFNQLGLVCFLHTEYAAAQAYMQESIRLDPDGKSRPYELLSKSLEKQNRVEDSFFVDFELIGKFSSHGIFWHELGTKLVAKGMIKEGLYFHLHGMVAAKEKNETHVAAEILRDYTRFANGLPTNEKLELESIDPEKYADNLARLKTLLINSADADDEAVTVDFASFLQSETGAKLKACAKPLAIFSLLSPEQETLSNARIKMVCGKYQEAVRLADPLLQNSDSKVKRAALAILANTYQKWGMSIAMSFPERRKDANVHFYKSSELYRKLDAEHSPLAGHEKREFSYAIYNEACGYAVEGDNAKAMTALRESFETGFPTPDSALTDDDFRALHNDNNLKRLVSKFGKRSR